MSYTGFREPWAEAWNLGYDAHDIGQNLPANPYNKREQAELFIEWQRGWHASERDAHPATE